MWVNSLPGPVQQYYQRFLEHLAHASGRNPLEHREELREELRSVLGLRHIPEPQIQILRATAHEVMEGVRLTTLVAESWKGCVGTALYAEPTSVPKDQPLPAVHVVCGHGQDGKHTPAYLSMVLLLAQQGARVLIHDNLGQGERVAMGHREVRLPFAYGFSLQGMIYQEALAWQKWLIAQPGVDGMRMGMAGNSGGGVLTLMFAAFSDRLAAIASSGYPSSFSFIALKEKHHCACNLLPGVVGRFEMWQLYGLFAPRPLFLFQGQGDPLFPPDLFNANALRVGEIYRRANAEAQLRTKMFEGDHPWDLPRVMANGHFFAETLGLQPPISEVWLTKEAAQSVPRCLESWPEDALNTEQLAASFVGARVPKSIPPLWEIVSPEMGGLDPASKYGHTHLGQVLAQYEIFLGSRKC